MKRLLAAGAALAAAGLAQAGGPLLTCDSAPVKYLGDSVTLHYDQGNLGSRTKAQADAIVNSAIAIWNDVPTSSIALSRGADLPVNVTTLNFTSYIGDFSFDDGRNPVVYDSDGSLIDLLLGEGASGEVLGFAGSAYYGFPECRYAEGRAVINGAIAISNTDMAVVIAHELGHLIGLDHTQLDSSQGLDQASYPLMYPIAFRDSATLHEDDVAAVSALYPSGTFAGAYGRLGGTLKNGSTALRGGNIWARNVATGQLFSTVSDYLMRGTGAFELAVPPGTYSLHVEAVQSNFDEGSSIGPWSETYPASPSFQAPFYQNGNPMAPVTFGGSASPTLVPITAGCFASANFQLDGSGTVAGDCGGLVFPLTVAKAGTGQGTVQSDPFGILCGPGCSNTFAAGSVVTLHATPAAGSTFGGWSGACSGTGFCTVTMSAARSVTATFHGMDDFPESFLSAPTVLANGLTAGVIDIPGDVDWLRFDFPSAGTWTVRSIGTTNVMATAYAPNGTTAYGSDDDTDAPNFRLAFTIGAATTVYVRVTGVGGATGAYTVVSAFDDFAGGFAQAAPLAIQGSTNGRIEVGGDEDWFRFDFHTPGMWSVRTLGISDTVGTAYAPDGVTVYASDDNAGEANNFRIDLRINAPTSVFLKVAAVTAQTVGSYQLVSGFTPLNATAADANGDRKSDILWRNAATGGIYRLLMDGLVATSGAQVYGDPDLSWRVAGEGDFDGDGVADIVWRNAATGHVSMGFFNGAGMIYAVAPVMREPSAAWRIVHTPDLDADGKNDLLWWNAATGQVWAMLMDGATIRRQGPVYTEPNTSWRIAAVGDFSGHGRRNQLLWHNQATGQVWLTTVNVTPSAFSATGQPVYREPNLAWKIAGAADFDRDGRTDILWRNDATGQVFMMRMNGASIASAAMVYAEPNLAWKIAALGDYDGDGRGDILWRNDTTGQVFLLAMNGFAITAAGVVYQEPDTAWKILGPAEFSP